MIANEFIKKESGYIFFKCYLCNNIIKRSTGRFNRELKQEKPTYCTCEDCRYSDEAKKLKLNRMKQTCLERYGVDNIYKKTDFIKNKIKEKYGVENVSQLPHIKEKIRKSNLRLEENGQTVAYNAAIKRMETFKEKHKEDTQGFCVKSSLEQTFLKKYGSKQFFGSEFGMINEEYYIKKYGEIEGPLKWKEKINKSKITVYNLSRLYGEEEAKIIYDNWRKKIAPTLENFIKRYGKKKGYEKFNNFYDQLSKNRGKGKVSKLELNFFDLIEKKLNIKIIRQIGLFRRTWDGLIENTNILLEVQGTFWHADPRFYKETDIFAFKESKEILVNEIWEKDKLKKHLAEKNDYKVLTFWEYDIKNNIDDILKFLEKEIK